MDKKYFQLVKNSKKNKSANSATYFNKRKRLLSIYWNSNFKVCIDEERCEVQVELLITQITNSY